jgi:hypothetical protein
MTDKQPVPGLTGGLKVIEYRVVAVVEPESRDSQLLEKRQTGGKIAVGGILAERGQ